MGFWESPNIRTRPATSSQVNPTPCLFRNSRRTRRGKRLLNFCYPRWCDERLAKKSKECREDRRYRRKALRRLRRKSRRDERHVRRRRRRRRPEASRPLQAPRAPRTRRASNRRASNRRATNRCASNRRASPPPGCVPHKWKSKRARFHPSATYPRGQRLVGMHHRCMTQRLVEVHPCDCLPVLNL